MAYTTINKSSDLFNTVLYSGNDSTQIITGVGFQPNLTWVKNRTDSSPHLIVDVIRGYGSSGKTLTTNSDAVDAANSSTSRFVDNGATSDGFTVGNSSYTNGNNKNYVSYNWKANNSTASNSDGSINSTVSVNNTTGISIVSYTGTGSNATVGHGLNTAPQVVWIKNRTDAEHWRCGHTSLSSNFSKGLHLSTNDGAWTQSGAFNNTAPTSSVFSVGTFNSTNGSGKNIMAYCFTEKTGFSKFGSYTGNNGENFIYTGFKPKWAIFKRHDSGDNWKVLDGKRSTYNVMNKTISADHDNAEATENDIYVDFLSNGIRLDGSNGAINANGGNYIFMAFGQSIVGTNNVPCTAR